MADYALRPIQQLQYSSPLDTLVHRTSSRRTKNPTAARSHSALGEPSHTQPAAPEQYSSSHGYASQNITPPRQRLGRPPSSPLLHTQFRSSTATASTATLDMLSKFDTSVGDEGQDVFYNDEESLYSSATVSSRYGSGMQQTPPESPDYHSRSNGGTSSPRRAALQGEHAEDELFMGIPSIYSDYRASIDTARPTDLYQELHQDYTSDRPRRSSDSQHIDPFAFQFQDDNSKAVPTVVISSADSNDARSLAASYVSPAPSPSRAGRTPSALPSGVNYSRPVRPPSEEGKRKVLERNAHRARTPQASPLSGSGSQTFQSMQSARPVEPHNGSARRHPPSPLSGQPSSPYAVPQTDGASTKPSLGSQPSGTQMLPSHVISASRSPSTRLSPHSPAPLTPLSPASVDSSQAQIIILPQEPPPISSSPIGSLYSAYSFYQLESPASSPTSDSLRVPGTSMTPPAQSQSKPPSPSPHASKPNTTDPRTPEDYLQLGIRHHEANRLAESAACFEQSAKLDGGTGVGMLMWGLTLRHGWGCPKNEKQGFAWLRRAAESAVEDLEHARQGMDTTAIRSELVLAIYEVGQCFFQGWGVKKDQKMAVSYYQVAAKLGDADAQQELAFCLANGKGCKKDRKEAAKWYRDAVAQGASDVGLAWIYKEKFQ
ncbi:hypothetical protein EW146_g8081 [Bondarzewia mesenterica]|uniref:HCP-like protein n=1 Tax=Bondarzewia mesenterica TaxID=1095465 RepID=A0A4S4LMU0_9AGAM|nr:hypothetical protein EW146_g8081 [Bondarzewia mesenterica]